MFQWHTVYKLFDLLNFGIDLCHNLCKWIARYYFGIYLVHMECKNLPNLTQQLHHIFQLHSFYK